MTEATQRKEAFTAMIDETIALLDQRILVDDLSRHIHEFKNLQNDSLSTKEKVYRVLDGTNLDIDLIKKEFNDLEERARTIEYFELAGKFQECRRLFLAAAAPPELHAFAEALSQNPQLKAMLEQVNPAFSKDQQAAIAQTARENPKVVEIATTMASTEVSQEELDAAVETLKENPSLITNLDKESPKQSQSSGWLLPTLALIACAGVGYGALRWWRTRSCTK